MSPQGDHRKVRRRAVPLPRHGVGAALSVPNWLISQLRNCARSREHLSSDRQFMLPAHASASEFDRGGFGLGLCGAIRSPDCDRIAIAGTRT